MTTPAPAADPEIRITPQMAARLSEALAPVAAEVEAQAPEGLRLPLYEEPEWIALAEDVKKLYPRHDHVVLRGLPVFPDGAMLIAALGILATRFRPYGSDGKVVKHFAMNPWSRDLARSVAEGFFHSDLNASPDPPALTGIQCIRPDPGAPQYGVNRIARLPDLLDELEKHGAHDVIRWMTETEVTMANDRSPNSWTGRIVANGRIRFHPETIRTAARRSGHPAPEDMLALVQEAAFNVSRPLLLGEGDMLLLSNYRTLHYRSECSVVFRHFPTDFIARRIYVAHATDD
jgi:hypothetical protein